jgi:Tfp pilus assembly protein FimT
MIIVVIIGIVAAMAAPKFSKTVNQLKFRTTARNMVSKLRLARSNAITHKQPFGVHVDNTEMIMTMFLDTQNPSLHQFDVGDSVLSADTLDDGFIYLDTDFGTPAIVYRPNGSATYTGNIWFMAYTFNDDVNIGHIQVLASTGRTKMGTLHYY